MNIIPTGVDEFVIDILNWGLRQKFMLSITGYVWSHRCILNSFLNENDVLHATIGATVAFFQSLQNQEGWYQMWLNRTQFHMKVNENSLLECYYAVSAGAKKNSSPSPIPMKPALARIFFWPNCCQWLNPTHLHWSPLKRDADELNERANYARSAWGASL